MSQPTRKLSIGLWIISLLYLVPSSFVAIGIALTIASSLVQGVEMAGRGVFVVMLGYCVGSIWIALGVLRRKNWARYAMIALTIAWLVFVVILVTTVGYNSPGATFILALPQLAYFSWVVWYLCRAHVKAIFIPS